MSRLPVRLRVGAAFAAALAAVLAATGWFLVVRLDSQLTQALDRELRQRAQDVAAVVGEGGSLAATGHGLVESGESYAELVDPAGRVLDSTPSLQGVPLLAPRELARALRGPLLGERQAVPGLDEPSRLLATRVTRGGHRLVLVVGLTSQDRAEALGNLQDELLLAGPAALIVASLAGYLLAGVSLRQVEAMRRHAASISAETPGERLPVPPTGDELERLGTTLNEMLERLEAGLVRERDFVTDAGHELRTPLALLRTELELALRHAASPDELVAAVRRCSLEVDRLARLAEDLLLTARAGDARLALRLETLPARDLLQTVARRFEWRAAELGRPLQVVAAPELELMGDRLRLEQALGNLADNALRYGEGTVTLSAGPTAGGLELEVADAGSGFPAEFLERAFERFARAEPAHGRPGAGLGLAIVRTIVQAHRGEVLAANSPAGGARVRLLLPRAVAD